MPEAGGASVYLSFDMEGVAGVVDWAQALGPGPEYEIGRRLLLGEVNAAIDGATLAGASRVVCNDAHGPMHNLAADQLHGGASYVAGRNKPLYMMQGLEPGFDVALFVGYHGSMGEPSVLSHTYNPAAVHEVRLNGEVVGESGINALVALHHGVPVGLVTGDQVTAREAARFLPGAQTVVVKESYTRGAASSLHPERARELIAAGARRAVERAGSLPLPAIELPARLEVRFLDADMAELASVVRGAERTGGRTVLAEGEDPLALYRTFVAMLAITRPAAIR